VSRRPTTASWCCHDPDTASQPGSWHPCVMGLPNGRPQPGTDLLLYCLEHLFLVNLLGAEEPVVAGHALFLAVHAVLRNAAGAGGRDDHVVAGTPVGRAGYREGVRGLQRLHHADELVEITADAQRVVDDGADDALGVDEEDGTHGLGCCFPGLDHAVLFGYVHRDVLDQRELHLDILHALVRDLLLDRPEPRNMAVEPVNRQADKLAVQLLELLLQRGEGHELGCAHGGEVGGVAEQDDPLAFVLLGEIDLALGGHCLEHRCLVADAGHGGDSGFCGVVHIILLVVITLGVTAGKLIQGRLDAHLF